MVPQTDPHEQLIQKFYDAFGARDAETMVACYHSEVEFSDPVFPDLKGTRAGGMWRMLCERAADLRIEASNITAAGGEGTAHWEAWYTFTATGRRVHNIIDARFAFRDGLIVRHTDRFDFWRWSRQALGPVGFCVGWSSWLRNRVRAQAARNLDRYLDGRRPRPSLRDGL